MDVTVTMHTTDATSHSSAFYATTTTNRIDALSTVLTLVYASPMGYTITSALRARISTSSTIHTNDTSVTDTMKDNDAQ